MGMVNNSAAKAFTRLIVFARLPILGEVKTRIAAELGKGVTLTMYRSLVYGVVQQALIAAASFSPPITVEWHYAGNWDDLSFEDSMSIEQFHRGGVQLIAQSGSDLGQRMCNALFTVDGPSILFGSDVPGLDASVLLHALNVIVVQNKPLVFNPTADGGYCLIGRSATTQASDVLKLFEHMPWSTNTVMSITLERLIQMQLVNRDVAWQLLPPLADIDEPHQARAYLKL